jgi:hypothetical protein
MVPSNVFSRDVYKPSVAVKEALEPAPNTSTPPADEPEAMQINREQGEATVASECWTLYLEYLLRGDLPLDKDKARRLARRAKKFILLGDEREMYRHSPSGILQWCIPISQGQ